nr:synaptotagmin-4-like [Oncorhynchus nerka]
MQSLTSQDAATSRGLSLSPQVQGQLFILLQYQTLAHRVKAMVLQADNLANLTPDSHVVINLRHDGLVIGTQETKGVGGANTPFLFDLPPGDVTTLPLVMEFIVMQEHVYSNNTVLGRVLIGPEAPETGRSHWRDMCSQGQVERARWHTVEQEPLENNTKQSDSRTLGY